MSNAHPGTVAEHGRADEVLAEYMQRLDRGEHVPRADLLADNPELADELRGYFAACDDVDQFTGGAAPSGTRLAYPAPPTPPADDTGAPVAGWPRLNDYEILEELARGGMGVVYKARQYVGAGTPRPYRIVALKMMRGGPLASAVDVQRFRTEAEAVANLDHPHIVPVYDVGQHEGHCYFSMRLIEGGSLAQALGARTCGSAVSKEEQRRVADLLEKVARAIHYAHQRGLVHRDLKPANILLDNDGQPHVTDFGLAKRVAVPAPASGHAEEPLTQSGLIVGTPNYMAPEQARARKALSTAADVYSLGAILYELLTGRPPFRAENPLATLVQVLDHEPRPPRALNPLVDRDLETICLKCLRKDPQARYGSAEALADDLRRWRRGEPIHARPIGTGERLVLWTRRRPALAAFALFSLTVALLGFAGVAWQGAEASAGRRRAVEERDRAEYLLYVRSLALAKYEGIHNVGRALAYLEECPPRYRRWEWYYLQRLWHAEGQTLGGHVGAAIGVAYSPDGRQLASTGADHTVRLWDVASGQVLHTLTGHADGVLAVAYSPDGRLLATAGADAVIKLWDVATGAERGVLSGHEKAFTSVAFSRDGTLLVSADEGGQVCAWDVAAGQLKAKLARHDGVASGVALSPDGTTVASAGWDGRVKLWDIRRGVELFSTSARDWQWTGVAFSPDGTLLAASSGEGRVQVWDVAQRRERFYLRTYARWVHAVAFSPDGTHLAATLDEGTVHVWELATEERLALVLHGPRRRVNGLAYSPDGSRLAAASTDGLVHLWDTLANKDEAFLAAHTADIHALEFDPAERWLASAGADGTVQLTDPRTRQPLRQLTGPGAALHSLAVSPAGLVAAGAADGTVRVWNAEAGLLLHTFTDQPTPVAALAWEATHGRLAAGATDGTVQVWASDGTRLARWLAPGGAVRALAFRADGRELFTVAADGALRAWDAATGRLVRELAREDGPATAAGFSPDGRHVAVACRGAGSFIQLRDAATGNPLSTLRGHTDLVTGLAFDGADRLASVGKDRTTRLWDVGTGQEVFVLARHARAPLAVAFGPGGRLLATGGEDKSVRVYDGTPR